MSKPNIQAIGSRISKWGEGPIWWKERLFYVDIERHALVQLDLETNEEVCIDVGERIGTIVPREKGGFIYAGDSGIIDFDPITDTKHTLADPESDKRGTNRFNDGKCDPAGRFWAGTISLIKKVGDAALYMLDTEKQLHVKINEVTNSNGICWSPDAKKLFYIDTPTKQVRAYDYDLENGDIANASIAVDTLANGFRDSPDGMTIDTDGNLWVAFCHGGCVACFDPLANKLLNKIDLPCVETTSCTFGGPEMDRLFVTTGLHKSIKEPDAGKVFVIDDLGVNGLPAFPFKG